MFRAECGERSRGGQRKLCLDVGTLRPGDMVLCNLRHGGRDRMSMARMTTDCQHFDDCSSCNEDKTAPIGHVKVRGCLASKPVSVPGKQLSNPENTSAPSQRQAVLEALTLKTPCMCMYSQQCCTHTSPAFPRSGTAVCLLHAHNNSGLVHSALVCVRLTLAEVLQRVSRHLLHSQRGAVGWAAMMTAQQVVRKEGLALQQLRTCM